MEQENRDYDPRDEDRDYSDLSDNGRSAIERAQSQWGSAKVINGDYDPSKLEEAENSNTSNNTSNVSEAEKSGNTSGWNTSVSGKNKTNAKKIKSKILSSKPTITIIGSIIGVMFGVSVLLSPSAIFFHILSLFSDSIANFQAPVVDSAYVKTLKNKIGVSSDAGCKVTKLACRFKSVSDFQLSRFEAAGIKVETGKSVYPGKSSISSMSITLKDGTPFEISPNKLSSALKNPEIRTALDSVYNPKFAQFSDSVWSTLKKKFKVDKNGAEVKDTEGKNTTVDDLKNELVSESNSDSNTKVKSSNEDKDGTKSAETDVDIELEDDVEVKSADAATTKLKNQLDAIGNKLNIVNAACLLPTVVKTINTGMKTVRAAQLIRFSTEFASYAGQIKAGDGTPELSTMLGNSLTTTTQEYSEDGKSGSLKSATDAPFLKWAMYGDSYSTTSSKQYSTGGNSNNISKIFSSVASKSNSSIGGVGGATCKIAASAAGDLLDLGITLITGGVAKMATSAMIEQVIVPAVMNAGGAWLVNTLGGNAISKNIAGEAFGNALGSGMTAMLSSSCISRGCTAMTKKAAVAYYSDQQSYLAKEAEYDRRVLSPFDTSNKNTFLGSIVASITPYYASIYQPATAISSILSITGSSFSAILPGTSAVSTAKYEESLNSCDDAYLESIGAAATPSCAPVAGITNSALNQDIDSIISDLSGKYINPDVESDDISDYIMPGSMQKYKEYCVDRTSPLGMDQDNSSSLKEIIFDNDSNFSISDFFGVGGSGGWSNGKNCVDTGNGENESGDPIAKFAAFFAAWESDDSMSRELTSSDDSSNTSSSINQDGKALIDEYVAAVGTGSVKGVTASFEQCAAFSQWYRAKISGDYQDHYNDNGNVFVDNTIADYTGWEKSSEPVAGSIFSIGSNTGSAWPTGEFGHTGIVLAIDGDKITIAHNNISTSAGSSYFSNANGLSGIGIWEVSLSEEIKPYNWTFAVYKGATS